MVADKINYNFQMKTGVKYAHSVERPLVVRILRYIPVRLFMYFNRKWGHLFFNYYFALQSIRILRNQEIEICVAHDSFALNAASSVSRLKDAKLVYDAVEIPLILHRSGKYLANNLSKWAIKLINEFVEPKIISSADLVISNSPGHMEWHSKNYELIKPPRLITNARPYQVIQRTRNIKTDTGLEADDKLVLYIGNANPRYGLEQILECLSLLPRHIHVGFLGFMPPAYATLIDKKAETAGVTGRFHKIPTVDYNQVSEYASGADLGVITLNPDVLNMELCLPNRFFDFVMARLPIVSSKIPQIVTYINKYGIGKIFDEKNPADMARVIGLMLSPEHIKAYQQSAEHAASELSWEHEAVKLNESMNSLVPDMDSLSICFFARKNIWRTNRIVRMAETLSSAGHTVTVVSLQEGNQNNNASKVTYLTVDDGRKLPFKILSKLKYCLGIDSK